MGMTWTERLAKVVLPALEEGIPVYTGLGELVEGLGLSDSRREEGAPTLKHPSLPVWHVYLPAKGHQPALRYLQFRHMVRNPLSSATQVYQPYVHNFRAGVSMIIPLGEGHDQVPSNELNVHRDMLALIMSKPVKVIALSRIRPFTLSSPWPFFEPVIMEVYSEAGECLWVNTFIGMTLEEALEGMRRSHFPRTVATARAPMPAPALPAIPFCAPSAGPAEPTASAMQNTRVTVDSDLHKWFGEGFPAEEIKGLLARSRGFDPKLASRLVDDFRRANEPALEVQAIIRDRVAQYQEFYSGDVLIQAVAEDSGYAMDLVRRVMGMTEPLRHASTGTQAKQIPAGDVTSAPAVASPQHDPSSTEDFIEAFGATQHQVSIEVQGPVYDETELHSVPPPPEPKAKPTMEARPATAPKAKAGKSDPDPAAVPILEFIRDNRLDLKEKVLVYLGTVAKAQAGDIRRALGIDNGSTDKGTKAISDLFRRTVLEDLRLNDLKIVLEGTTRVSCYRIARR